MSINLDNRILAGQNCGYVGIERKHTMVFCENGRSFDIALYGAYDAFGLIGPENNGIVIFDNDNHRVVLDQHCQIGTGWFGPSQKQVDEQIRIMEMKWPAFAEFVNNNKRTRESLII